MSKPLTLETTSQTNLINKAGNGEEMTTSFSNLPGYFCFFFKKGNIKHTIWSLNFQSLSRLYLASKEKNKKMFYFPPNDDVAFKVIKEGA